LNDWKAKFETRRLLYGFQGLKPGAFKRYGSTGFDLYSPTSGVPQSSSPPPASVLARRVPRPWYAGPRKGCRMLCGARGTYCASARQAPTRRGAAAPGASAARLACSTAPAAAGGAPGARRAATHSARPRRKAGVDASVPALTERYEAAFEKANLETGVSLYSLGSRVMKPGVFSSYRAAGLNLYTAPP
jgi:hypothetical protein